MTLQEHRIRSGRIVARFWTKVEKSSTCWEWTAARAARGYGRFMLEGRARKAHRIAWELTNGPIPDEICVLHRCDNPPCVRPDHLFLGTLSDNSRDMAAKGRQTLQAKPHLVRRGSQLPYAKLNEDKVRRIRERLAAGARPGELAREFGIGSDSIYLIRAGRTWRHVA